MACTVDPTLSKVWRFEVNNGNSGEMSVQDPLLDTEDRSRERAMSEILKNGYANNSFQFRTYRTDLVINQIVNIYGVPYLVKNIATAIDDTKMVSSITVKRYD